jgi:isoquinoline 1-oxidoreductase beta subunit
VTEGRKKHTSTGFRTLLGSGFGRRLLVDFVVQAALVSKAVGKPVKVVWSREEDMQHDVYRPATLNRVTAGLDKEGAPLAFAHKVVSPSILQFVYALAVTEDNDPSCLEGLMETHYEIPSQRVDFKLLKVGVPTSVLRTTGYGPNIFAVESFIDELAFKAKQNPYDFRRALLKAERSLKVLETLVQKSDWKKKPTKGIARGMAYTEAFRTHIAHVVELSVNEKLVKIHRITCAIDSGVALDPEITKNSIEGGTVWGLAWLSSQTSASRMAGLSNPTSMIIKSRRWTRHRRSKYISSTAARKVWAALVDTTSTSKPN